MTRRNTRLAFAFLAMGACSWLAAQNTEQDTEQSAASGVELVAAEAPQRQAWVGEKTAFFVKLRGQGPFVGASAFSVPQVPRCVVLKVGNPVVSTEELQGKTWFVQTHEFALFSQQEGRVTIPRFEARFANRDGFTGPARDHAQQVPSIAFDFQRPAGSDPHRLLVTTDSLEVREQWEPTPGPAELGAIFQRTITQRASQVTGIALAAPPSTAPEGIRLHVDDPVIRDNTQRGEFIGNRSDTLTYVFQQPGTFTIPAIDYLWWDAKQEKLQNTTLPAQTILVPAPPPTQPRDSASPWWLAGLALLALLAGLAILRRRELWLICNRIWRSVNPPHRAAARQLLRACRRNDARAAETAWQRWQTAMAGVSSHERGIRWTPELQAAATDLHRHLYGTTSAGSVWLGRELALAFKVGMASSRSRAAEPALPTLNPGDRA